MNHFVKLLNEIVFMIFMLCRYFYLVPVNYQFFVVGKLSIWSRQKTGAVWLPFRVTVQGIWYFVPRAKTGT